MKAGKENPQSGDFDFSYKWETHFTFVVPITILEGTGIIKEIREIKEVNYIS